MLKLHLYDDPVLRTPTTSISPEELPHILLSIEEITHIMYRSGGIAIAANQVGVSKRFFIMIVDNVPKLFINPEIIESNNIKPFTEGCLSIPGTSASINRAMAIKVKYFDSDFLPQESIFTNLQAVAVQHEIEHLDGKLYIDNLSGMEKLLKIKQHKQFIKR